ncbi:hypothetical protein EX30DRAFT_242884 [Ascodesmis nigricans]|uniref:Uncharacterized protein n=1 Tax=Ascodesmis nigricans TaxID=341454 RepID=A0A4V3SHK2_9PEZI|nr:hypothetical protein EX30DRAFT_242884 [Ascodesmis nigricans]
MPVCRKHKCRTTHQPSPTHRPTNQSTPLRYLSVLRLPVRCRQFHVLVVVLVLVLFLAHCMSCLFPFPAPFPFPLPRCVNRDLPGRGQVCYG